MAFESDGAEATYVDITKEDPMIDLPHSLAVEDVARRVILKAYAYKISDPERLVSAYRVVERNRRARERASLRVWVVA